MCAKKVRHMLVADLKRFAKAQQSVPYSVERRRKWLL